MLEEDNFDKEQLADDIADAEDYPSYNKYEKGRKILQLLDDFGVEFDDTITEKFRQHLGGVEEAFIEQILIITDGNSITNKE